MHEHDRNVKLEQLRSLGIDPYEMPNVQLTPIGEARRLHQSSYSKDGPILTVAGRIMLRRGMGKLSFLTIADTVNIQLALEFSRLSELDWQKSKLIDLGDIIIAEGNLGSTKTGEITIWVTKFHIVSKALTPPPDKVEGLKDPELKVRNRHMDLWNPDVMATMVKRSQIVATLRDFLHASGFMEVETPCMQASAGGAIAKPFVTHHNSLNMDLHLRIAPELYLKRLLIGGMAKVFEIGKNFRNEGISNRHNPEFTSLEAYEAYGNYETMMQLVESMVCYVAKNVMGTLQIPYGDNVIDLQPPWRRIKMLNLAPSVEMYENHIEQTLIQPTFVTHMPKSIVPLAKESKIEPGCAEAFELVIGGMEIAPGYTELNDPHVQLKNFTEQGSQIDTDFIDALKCGMPPAGGLGIGIDRLVSIFVNEKNIRDVILFPLLREKCNT